MKFCWSTLKVKDLEASLKFYQEFVGLKIDRRFKAGPGMEIVFLGDGETKIELIYDENSKEIDAGKDISWGFEVGSLDEMMKLAKEKGVELQSGVLQPNPHVRFFYALDPNGMKIQFVENM